MSVSQWCSRLDVVHSIPGVAALETKATANGHKPLNPGGQTTLTIKPSLGRREISKRLPAPGSVIVAQQAGVSPLLPSQQCPLA